MIASCASLGSETVTPRPIPTVPWQLTGNHWLSLPCIHPADGAVHAIGVLHRGARAAIEFAGAREFEQGTGAPLLAPGRPGRWRSARTRGRGHRVGARGRVAADVHVHDRHAAGARHGVRAVRPRCGHGGRRLRDRRRESRRRHAQRSRSRSRERSATGSSACARRAPFDDAHRVVMGDDETVICSRARAMPGLVALAIGADGPARAKRRSATREPRRPSRCGATLQVAPASRARMSRSTSPPVPSATAPQATVARAAAPRLARAARRHARRAAAARADAPGTSAIDRLINRNLLFAYFYGVGRALDDAHYYLVRTRAPWHGRGVTVRDWEALMWTLPAVQLADTALARELLLRMCELHGYAPGQGVHYLDGTLFEPGFSLEGRGGVSRSPPTATSATPTTTRSSRSRCSPTRCTSRPTTSRRDATSACRSTRTEVTPVGRAGAAIRSRCTATRSSRRRSTCFAARSTRRPRASRGSRRPCARRCSATSRRSATARRTLRAAIDLAGGSVARRRSGRVGALAAAVRGARSRRLARIAAPCKASRATIGALLRAACARLLGPDGDDGAAVAASRAARRRHRGRGRGRRDGRATANGGDAALAGLLASHGVVRRARAGRARAGTTIATAILACRALTRSALYSASTRE